MKKNKDNLKSKPRIQHNKANRAPEKGANKTAVDRDNFFMQTALDEAEKAFKNGEVPIGAVLVKDGKIVAKAHNKREKKQNALLHAEILCIDKACKKLHSWRLENCQMFVTLEPCPMCAGAIVNARIFKVTFACKEKTACDNLCEKILQSPRLNHTCTLAQDPTLEKEAAQLLSSFFKQKRL